MGGLNHKYTKHIILSLKSMKAYIAAHTVFHELKLGVTFKHSGIACAKIL